MMRAGSTGTSSRRFVVITSATAKAASGTKPIQNFVHQIRSTETGAVRSTQSERPSRLTIGKTKRTATDVVTNAPSPRLSTIAMSRICSARKPSPSIGSARKL